MKFVCIVGTGTNGTDSLTLEAKRAIDGSEMLIGAGRMLEPYRESGRLCAEAVRAEDILSEIIKGGKTNYAVLMSGDVGFYSGTSALLPLLKDFKVRLVPGISSVNAFFARIGKPWHDAEFVSLHGRNADIVSAVRRNAKTFCITGGGVPEIAALLTEYGFGKLRVYVGEKLGYEDERISETTAEELALSERDSLCVLLIENPHPRTGLSFGMADEDFIRGEVPMTKSEVRAVTLSKLRLEPSHICYDIGAGTGSVTVEMALSCHKGRVYAIEREKDAAGLIRQNALKHQTANIEILHGQAPEALRGLPAPDAVFVGGAGGNLRDIIAAVLEKNRYARIVINAVTLETLHSAAEAMREMQIEPEIAEISVSKARKLGKYNLMTAQNPVFIISGQAKQGE